MCVSGVKSFYAKLCQVNALVGYGRATTGGGSGTGVTVTSCSALSAAVANGGVIRISGLLNCGAVIDVESNTSIIGVGSNSGMPYPPTSSPGTH
jgi:pectate lyase